MLRACSCHRTEAQTMRTALAEPAHSTIDGELGDLLASWRRHLRAQRISPATISTYSTAVGQLARYLKARGMPTDPAAVHREHVEAFITDLLERWKPATAHNRYRGCHAFFRWLVEEGEIRENPMARMKPPRLPEEPPPVLREAELRAILAACERDKTFAGRRDEAVLRIFIDTGARRAEVLGLSISDVDLEQGLLRVIGKGGRTRLVPVGAQTIRAVDRYLRARSKHPAADLASLWVGKKGRLTESGLAELVRDRGAQAGIPGRLHPHMFRHAYAHMMLASGMQETDLMAVVGWRSRDMVARYAAATRAERAIAAARALSPVDRIDTKSR
jgi:site-specific recombinase XerD